MNMNFSINCQCDSPGDQPACCCLISPPSRTPDKIPVLRSIWAPAQSVLKRAACGMGGRIDGKAFVAAARLVVSSESGLVSYERMSAAVGEPELEALIQNNLLALRPSSEWASDVSVEMFSPLGPEEEIEVRE